MIIYGQAPVRVSLFGGGTDLDCYYRKFGGIAISLAINIRQRMWLYSKDDPNCPKKASYPPKANPEFYDRIFKYFNLEPEIIKAEFDTNIETGLGSSASAAVLLVGLISKRLNLGLRRREIAEIAWRVELEQNFGGKQDQYAAVYGGANVYYFNLDGTVFKQRIDDDKVNYMMSHLLLFSLNEPRKGTKIQEQLKEPNNEQIIQLNEIKRIAKQAKNCLDIGTITDLGDLLRLSWEAKKKANPQMTTKRIDDLYDLALSYGADGGKLCGSGGGGSMVFWAKPYYRQEVIENLENSGCRHLDFSVDRQGMEARIL